MHEAGNSVPTRTTPIITVYAINSKNIFCNILILFHKNLFHQF